MSHRFSRALSRFVPILAVAVWFGIAAPSASAIYLPPTPTPLPTCGTVTYEKSSDFDDAIVEIDYESLNGWPSGYNRRVDVLGNNGWSVARVWLDVENDGHSGYHLYANGPLTDFNPNPGDRITQVKAELSKPCADTASVTIVKNTIGGNGTFHFVGMDTEGGFNITTEGGTGSRVFSIAIDDNDNERRGHHDDECRGHDSDCDEEEDVNLSVSEAVLDGWTLMSAVCKNARQQTVGSATQDGRGISFDVSSGDAITCTFENEKQGGSNTQFGTLEIEKIVVGSTQSFAGHWFAFNAERDILDADGLNVYTRPVGSYAVVEDVATGFVVTYGGDCDAQGALTLEAGATARCIITNTAEGYVPSEPAAEEPVGGSNDEVVLGATVGDPANLDTFKLKDGNLIRASEANDPDVYVVNAHGYKRLFLNPTLFGYDKVWGGWKKIKPVTAEARDAFPTSALLRNCEADDTKVYAMEVTGEDTGLMHWVNMTSETAIAEDANFFAKVFCVNNDEFSWFKQSDTAYTSLAQVPVYSRW